MILVRLAKSARAPACGKARHRTAFETPRRRRRQVHPRVDTLESRQLQSAFTASLDTPDRTVLVDPQAHAAARNAQPAATPLPARFYAPYVDMSLSELYMPEQKLLELGVKDFNLGFITAPRGAGTEPVWGGNANDAVGGPFDQTRVLPLINRIRAQGGDVMVVFGGASAGASGYDLAQRITNVNTLAQTYLKVINTYNVTHVDFDVEDAALLDPGSIDRRLKAIEMVQTEMKAQGKTLDVWFTLPSNPETGLTPQGYDLIDSAINAEITISGVNIMTMDFGTYYPGEQPGQMGALVESAANKLFSQLRRLYPTDAAAQLHQMMGITPMIGQNDTVNEVFYAQDATMLEQYAKQNGIGMVADWSLSRDRPKPGENPRDTAANPDWSGIAQPDLEFARILAKSVQ